MQSEQRLSAIFFDMDGTIFGTEEIWFQSEIKLMNRFGANWTRADHAICVGGPISRVTEYMLNRLNHAIDAKELFKLEMEYIEREFAQSEIPWQPGAKELVFEAKENEIPIALVTASNRHLVNLVSAQIDLSIFECIVTGDDVENPKPAPDAYVSAIRQLQAVSSNAVAIEDSNSGVRSALGAGLHVLCPPSHTITVEDPRLKLVNSLAGLRISNLEHWRW